MGVGAGLNTPCRVTAAWSWSFAPPEAAPTPPPPGGPWTVSANTLQAGPGAQVSATVQHTPGAPPCDTGEVANSTPMQLTAGSVVQPSSGEIFKGAAAQVTHGNHRDGSSLLVQVRPAGSLSQVTVTGIHAGKPVSIQPSFQNPFPDFVRGTITPDYRLGGVVTSGPSVAFTATGGSEADLPRFPQFLTEKGVDRGVLSSFQFTFSSSPLSDTQLAFLGLVDGVFTELDFDLGILLFTGGAEFMVPGLHNDATELFIGVDLTQWLTSPKTFSPGDVFTFIGGVSLLAPGFLVGTTPVTLGAFGFETSSPFTGDAVARAVLDGQTVPEPGSIVLLGIGVLALGSYTWNRRREALRRMSA